MKSAGPVYVSGLSEASADWRCLLVDGDGSSLLPREWWVLGSWNTRLLSLGRDRGVDTEPWAMKSRGRVHKRVHVCECVCVTVRVCVCESICVCDCICANVRLYVCVRAYMCVSAYV